jgi:hypothetical protein
MIVISIENISKYYRLGSIGNRTLYEDLNRWWGKLRGKPDPTLRVDQLPPPKEHQGTTNEEPRTNNQEPRTTNDEPRTKNEKRRTKNEERRLHLGPPRCQPAGAAGHCCSRLSEG